MGGVHWRGHGDGVAFMLTAILGLAFQVHPSAVALLKELQCLAEPVEKSSFDA